MVKAMYIDDDEDDRDLVKEILKRAQPDLDVSLAASGIEAFNTLKTLAQSGDNLPCVIILDLNMPGWDGKKTYLEIRGNDKLKNIPIAIFTSSRNPADQRFFESEKAVRYFTKSDSVLQLIAILKDVLKDC